MVATKDVKGFFESEETKIWLTEKEIEFVKKYISSFNLPSKQLLLLGEEDLLKNFVAQEIEKEEETEGVDTFLSSLEKFEDNKTISPYYHFLSPTEAILVIEFQEPGLREFIVVELVI